MDEEISNIFLSRKISLASFSRHWVGWSLRQFTLREKSGLLEIRDLKQLRDKELLQKYQHKVDEEILETISNDEQEDGLNKDDILIVELVSPSTTIGKHYYSTDNSHWLWINFLDKKYMMQTEIIIKFIFEEEMLTYLSKLNCIINIYKNYINKISLGFLPIFSDYIKEKVTSHIINDKILKSDECEAKVQFYNTNYENEDEDDDVFELDLDVNDDDEISDKIEPNEEATYIDIRNLGKSTFASKLIKNKNRLESNLINNAKSKNSQLPLIPSIPIPPLHILIMVVGTRGDVEPFVLLAHRLQKDGHRIRLATHETFRDYIVKSNIEFYPLAGDPVVLSKFMVKTQGFIIPTTKEAINEAPGHRLMLIDIMKSCWSACIQNDNDSFNFAPDAIISNPVTYGHVHCAEALGIPLHLMFPQPWTPTKAFPHPLSSLSYSKKWCIENYLSYQAVDRGLWIALEKEINTFRVQTLGLEPLRSGQGGWNILNSYKIPFIKMWSPSLLPKPKDWESHIDVSGTFFDENIDSNNSWKKKFQIIKYIASSGLSSGEKLKEEAQVNEILNTKLDEEIDDVPSNTDPHLVRFLFNNSENKPILFVGFGSMVMDIDLYKKILSYFLDTCAMLNIRIIVQYGWSKITKEEFEEMAQKSKNLSKLNSDTKESKQNEESDLNISFTDMSDEENFNEARSISTEEVSKVQKFTSLISSIFSDKIKQSTSRPSSFSTSSPPPSTSRTSTPAPERESISFDDDYLESITNENSWNPDEDAIYIGPCLHTWLFKHVHCVVHHGGAGTTATGLRYGCPTWICPFFGDQFLWGEMVKRKSLGPSPCSVDKLNLNIVYKSINLLIQKKTLLNAIKTNKEYEQEHGVENAVNIFYKHLPLDDMICDISALCYQKNETHKIELAKYYCPSCGLKFSSSSFSLYHNQLDGDISQHKQIPITYKSFGVKSPDNFADHLVIGFGGFLYEFIEGVTAVVSDPLYGIYEEGLVGGINGLFNGVNGLIKHQIKGSNILLKRLYESLNQIVMKNKNDDDFEKRNGSKNELLKLFTSLLNKNKKNNKNGKVILNLKDLTSLLEVSNEILFNKPMNDKLLKIKQERIKIIDMYQSLKEEQDSFNELEQIGKLTIEQESIEKNTEELKINIEDIQKSFSTNELKLDGENLDPIQETPKASPSASFTYNNSDLEPSQTQVEVIITNPSLNVSLGESHSSSNPSLNNSTLFAQPISLSNHFPENERVYDDAHFNEIENRQHGLEDLGENIYDSDDLNSLKSLSLTSSTSYSLFESNYSNKNDKDSPINQIINEKHINKLNILKNNINHNLINKILIYQKIFISLGSSKHTRRIPYRLFVKTLTKAIERNDLINANDFNNNNNDNDNKNNQISLPTASTTSSLILSASPSANTLAIPSSAPVSTLTSSNYGVSDQEEEKNASFSCFFNLVSRGKDYFDFIDFLIYCKTYGIDNYFNDQLNNENLI